MGPSHQCFTPSHKIIGSLVLANKIFKGFLPYMGMAAILVMWPKPCEQTFIPPSYWGSIWNLALIGQTVLEKKIFENGGRRTDDDRQTTDGRTTDHGYTISSPMSLNKTNLLFVLSPLITYNGLPWKLWDVVFPFFFFFFFFCGEEYCFLITLIHPTPHHRSPPPPQKKNKKNKKKKRKKKKKKKKTDKLFPNIFEDIFL